MGKVGDNVAGSDIDVYISVAIDEDVSLVQRPGTFLASPPSSPAGRERG